MCTHFPHKIHADCWLDETTATTSPPKNYNGKGNWSWCLLYEYEYPSHPAFETEVGLKKGKEKTKTNICVYIISLAKKITHGWTTNRKENSLAMEKELHPLSLAFIHSFTLLVCLYGPFLLGSNGMTPLTKHGRQSLFCFCPTLSSWEIFKCFLGYINEIKANPKRGTFTLRKKKFAFFLLLKWN